MFNDAEINDFATSLIKSVVAVEDAFYLNLIVHISEETIKRGFSQFGRLDDGNNLFLKNYFEERGIDKQVMTKILYDWGMKYNVMYSRLEQLLFSKNPFIIFWSHAFNTSSCIRLLNIIILPLIAKKIVAIDLKSINLKIKEKYDLTRDQMYYRDNKILNYRKKVY